MKIVGIDTGVTSKHCAVVVDSETSKSSKPIHFGTHTEEFNRMVKEASITGKPEIFAIETAGEAWYALALHLHKLGFKVAIVSLKRAMIFEKAYENTPRQIELMPERLPEVLWLIFQVRCSSNLEVQKLRL